MSAATAVVHAGVTLGDDVFLGAWVELGVAPRGSAPGEISTLIRGPAHIRSQTIVYAGVEIGHRFECGHAIIIREHSRIGDDVSIGSQSIIEHHVTVGNLVRLHSGVFIPEYSVLESGCWIGPRVVFTNAKHPLSEGVKARLIGPRIGQHAIIGANATLLPGITIGERAIVGAGAVVVADVAPDAVVVGNPARTVKTRSDIREYGAAAVEPDTEADR